ncbi:AMP-binding protein, partial [Burkholderia sp. SIMBA_013]
ATEAAIWSNYQDVAQVPGHWRSIPYGRPLDNQCFRVVDSQGRDCPDWVPGEQWIGGAGVAAGYRGLPTLSAQRFVEHEGRRWYRTGDQG